MPAGSGVRRRLDEDLNGPVGCCAGPFSCRALWHVMKRLYLGSKYSRFKTVVRGRDPELAKYRHLPAAQQQV